MTGRVLVDRRGILSQPECEQLTERRCPFAASAVFIILFLVGLAALAPRRLVRPMATFDALWDATREKQVLAGDAKGDVIYWMRRDQRAHDNWALLRARSLAAERGGNARVAFVPLDDVLRTARHRSFALVGLKETAAELGARGYALDVLDAPPGSDGGAAVAAFARSTKAAAVVVDFSPLRSARSGVETLRDALAADGVAVSVVDAHNVVPLWEASDKKEVGARTIRRKINDQLRRYLTEFPRLEAQDVEVGGADLGGVRAAADASVAPVALAAGPKAGAAALEEFCVGGRLKRYEKERNDPNADAQSGLSPYFHFGQLAPQRAALRVKAESKRYGASVAGFLEESIVRRELSDNFCYYQPDYDSLDGAAGWARDSLELHAADDREHTYTLADFEAAETVEDIWNAAQRQLATEGKMHGFMRMYWAKKILEWSAGPAEALKTALYLNDKYSLDGSDPSGYVGVAWSIMGTHDMGWKERPVFGKIRYMNYNGCKRKFDVKAYAAAYPAAAEPPPAKKRRA